MKIIGFSQLHNELEKGNLKNWFNCMNRVCDKIYIYDQGSTDGSIDYYKNFDNVVVIYSKENNFLNEIVCKDQLLKLLQKNEGYDNWIFWMDGDTITSKNVIKANLKSILENTTCNMLKLRHYNLWRSDTYYRVDDGFHGFFNKGVVCLWKNKEGLSYISPKSGLHMQQYPGLPTVKMNIVEDMYLIHRGFSTDYQLIKKFNIYRDRGMSGRSLARIIFENGLTVEKLPKDILPEWFEVTDDINPINKEKLENILLQNALASKSIYSRGELFVISGCSKKFNSLESVFQRYVYNDYR